MYVQKNMGSLVAWYSMGGGGDLAFAEGYILVMLNLKYGIYAWYNITIIYDTSVIPRIL